MTCPDSLGNPGAADSPTDDAPPSSPPSPLARPARPLSAREAAAYLAATMRPSLKDRSITPAHILDVADWHDSVRARLAAEAEEGGAP